MQRVRFGLMIRLWGISLLHHGQDFTTYITLSLIVTTALTHIDWHGLWTYSSLTSYVVFNDIHTLLTRLPTFSS